MAIRKRRLLLWLVVAAAVGFAVLQVLPVGAARSNPPVTEDAPWPDEASRRLARDACYDCHSNETDWPWYSYVAPMKWLVIQDVVDGRDELNFSEWDEDDNDADEAAETTLDGDMPPSRYTRLHPDAELSDEEREQLAAALEAMDERREGGDEEREDDDDDRSGSSSGPG
jgi:hypothetical protein